jgi:hypothetical protein
LSWVDESLREATRPPKVRGSLNAGTTTDRALDARGRTGDDTILSRTLLVSSAADPRADPADRGRRPPGSAARRRRGRRRDLRRGRSGPRAASAYALVSAVSVLIISVSVRARHSQPHVDHESAGPPGPRRVLFRSARSSRDRYARRGQDGNLTEGVRRGHRAGPASTRPSCCAWQGRSSARAASTAQRARPRRRERGLGTGGANVRARRARVSPNGRRTQRRRRDRRPSRLRSRSSRSSPLAARGAGEGAQRVRGARRPAGR